MEISTKLTRFINSCKKNNNSLQKFSVDKLPFVFQSEYFSLAWGKKHEGYFIDPTGHIYEYNMPKKWNFYSTQNENTKSQFWGHEVNGIIKPSELFDNLRNSKNAGKIEIGEIAKIRVMINDIMTSDIQINEGGCDMGIKSKVVLVYNPDIGAYQRFILSTSGDEESKNMSVYTDVILYYLNII